MPKSNEPLEIIAQAVERAVNPATGEHSVRVRLRHTTEEGTDCEWSIWIPNEEDFTRAVELARKQLDRISARIAAAGADLPDATAEGGEGQASPTSGEPHRRRRPDKIEPTGSGWAD